VAGQACHGKAASVDAACKTREILLLDPNPCLVLPLSPSAESRSNNAPLVAAKRGPECQAAGPALLPAQRLGLYSMTNIQKQRSHSAMVSTPTAAEGFGMNKGQALLDYYVVERRGNLYGKIIFEGTPDPQPPLTLEVPFPSMASSLRISRA